MLARPFREATCLARGLSTSAWLHQSSGHRVSSLQTPMHSALSGRYLVKRGSLSAARANFMRPYSSDLPFHHKVNLPALSPTMEVGTIVSWEKKVGDQVSEGDLLCEIETDKATMGFETPEEGYLAKIILPGGSKDVKIGKLLCIIVANKEDVDKFKDFVPDEKDSSVDNSKPAAAPVAGAQPPEVAAMRVPPVKQKPIKSSPLSPAPKNQGLGDFRAFASPAAKRLAAERGVDLSQIKSGSGMDGLITSKDVEALVASGGGVGQPLPAAEVPFLEGFGPRSSYSESELSNMRKTIAKRLQASKMAIPHYYLTVDCEMDSVMSLRSDFNKQNEKEGIKLSINDFIIKATALACKRVPECNSAWMESFIREYHSCDVSVAVDTGKGLITPIVTSAESKGLAEISSTVKELANRAREGRLQPQEFQGGTITVSNLGMFGIDHFTAIINPPQSCILAVGATKKKVVPGQSSEKPFKTVNVMNVTLSCDHRVVDGAVGAQWLKHFKTFIENPISMLL